MERVVRERSLAPVHALRSARRSAGPLQTLAIDACTYVRTGSITLLSIVCYNSPPLRVAAATSCCTAAGSRHSVLSIWTTHTPWQEDPTKMSTHHGDDTYMLSRCRRPSTTTRHRCESLPPLQIAAPLVL